MFNKLLKAKICKGLTLTWICFYTASCSDSPKNKDLIEPTFTSLYNLVFSQDCRDCHMPGGDAYDNYGIKLNFSTQSQAYSTLTSLGVTVGCNGVSIVSSTPETSYLMGTLYSDFRQNNFAGVGGCFPGNTHIEDTNISSLANSVRTQLIQWIDQGAPNN